MTDAQARVIARMRRLKAQGRRPELTAGDAAVTLGTDEDSAREVLTELVHLKALHRAAQRHGTLPGVWRLAE